MTRHGSRVWPWPRARQDGRMPRRPSPPTSVRSAAAGEEPLPRRGDRRHGHFGQRAPSAGTRRRPVPLGPWEPDEHGRAFLGLDPEVGLVTNVDHDHVDLFPTRQDVEDAFADFADRVVPGGSLVACADDAGAARLLARELPGRTVSAYGTAARATYRLVDVAQGAEGVAFHLAGPFAGTVAVRLRLAGTHNALNAAGALAAADALGVPARASAIAFASFSGTERRLEELGAEGGVTVIDDYAHHPTEIRASIEAVRPRTTGRLLVVFQPHTPSRLRAFFDDF